MPKDKQPKIQPLFIPTGFFDNPRAKKNRKVRRKNEKIIMKKLAEVNK